MSTPAGYLRASGEWLVGELKRLQGEAERRRVEISENNASLIALNASADRIADATKRDQVKSAVRELVKRQATIVGNWRTWWGNTTKTATQGIQWLREHGYATTGLSGPELLPLALIGGLVAGGALWVWNAKIKADSAATKTQAADVRRLNDSYIAGQITERQYLEMSRAATARPPSPGGDPLHDVSQAAIIIGALAAGVFLLPKLLEMFDRPRRRALAGGA